MIFHGFLSTITSFINEITPHICNVCFITFLVCSEVYFVSDRFEKQSWVWNWKRPPKHGRRCAWMVPLYNMHIVSIKSKLLWERETNTEGELLYFSSELSKKSWWPQLKSTFLLNYVKKVDGHNSNLLLDLTFSSNVMFLYRVVIYDLLHTGLHLRPSKSQ